MENKQFLLVVSWIFFVVVPVYAEDGEQAKLYRVDDGVFQLYEGTSIDLTDRSLLLALRRGHKCLEILINGRPSCIEVGKRFDLKRKHSPFHLGSLFSDKDRCSLDVVQIEAPKGAEALATFRLHCL